MCVTNEEKIRNSFTSFINKVIENTAINYKKKLANKSKNEIHLSDDLEISGIVKNTSIADTFVEDVNYLELEKVFTNVEYSNSMKKLTDKEKLVLYLTVIEEQPLKKVANLLGTTEDNISKIKYRAKNKFLKYLKRGEK